MSVLYYTHPTFLLHDTGSGHPECADRLRAIDRALTAPTFAPLIKIQPTARDDVLQCIELVHSPAMLHRAQTLLPSNGLAYLDADTVLSPYSLTAALLAVDAACSAVDRVCEEPQTKAFCAVRPPGHHAEPDRSMGFCLFNNIAIAAEYARRRYALQRIAIVDFDVHHGNGTQAIFALQPQVLYASSHQWPHYPGSGHASETGVGNIVNLPLAAGTGSAAFREGYRQRILPAVAAFEPELLLISAGFDGHRDDPLAGLQLTADDFGWLTDELVAIADRHSQGRIVSLLEGGYHLQALADSVAAHVAALLTDTQKKSP